MALSTAGEEEADETAEDRINRIMEARKLLPNASYFAFTATPKNKKLEIFGRPLPQVDGKVRHEPFHSYTMKQAIQKGFILDVLKHYTPIDSHYRLVKTVESDPESTPSARPRSCVGTLRATTMPSASRRRSWSTTSTSRSWRSTRSAGRHGRWW
jgi:hypothetical protein